VNQYNYNFTVQREVTYLGAQFSIKVNTVPLDLTGASILCQFRKAPLKPVILEWNIGSGITVPAPASGGLFNFDEQIITIPSGSYQYDVEITLASGKRVNYLYGTLTVRDIISIPTP
jgi:hypothetical protein